VIECAAKESALHAAKAHIIATAVKPQAQNVRIGTSIETFVAPRKARLYTEIEKEKITMEIKIKYHNKNMEKMELVQHGDWIDLRAAERVEMKAGDFKIISLGVSMKLPEGYEAHVAPRSSTFKKWGVLQANSVGVIDNSYSGENDIWGFPALAMRDTVIEAGDRIAQFRIMKKMEMIVFTEVDHMEDADRGGFGSTGAN